MKINGVAIKAPNVIAVNFEQVYGTEETNAAGDVIVDLLKTRRILDLTWGLMTQAQMVVILTQTASAFVTIEYPDPQLGVVTKSFYVGNKSPVKSLITRSGVTFWESLAIQFKEKT